MKKILTIVSSGILLYSCNPKLSSGLRKNDLKRDVEMITDNGILVIRLSDSTPLHRDNFIKLVKEKFYDSILFHRVIQNFMIQAGDPETKPSTKPPVNGQDIKTIPSEFRTSLFHKKGAVAAARTGDDINPLKVSSGSQFYIVQGRLFSNDGLDSVEKFRLNGRKLLPTQRDVYKTIGGVPHLDQNYTVFGEVVKGIEVIDSIAKVKTTGHGGGDRPLIDVRILKARLIRRN